ncbi:MULTISPECIES: aldehyde dehydrogenase family protein [Brucella]|jgi:succinate-semialdehyde dehydrogenase/glutarate-semialdehyde dehydrogenase|uniref:aldehyde dehydrogenase family protein n=1 Tax=Brucella TaxID=234 RepID=UPI000CFB2D9E|nr:MULTISPECIES: NAD-dependent succinate-semialdehyde dehydrogenase [Brucella]MQP42580.1 aldehyde dehydrogenase family protein [Ochrobactrum sp. MYb237]PQZ41004.1 NAD-dependent succinate-semialdehyde dehydrogenase [Brucella pseudogrignonensis]PRA37302.1 NAD-dependent succinate-semialdehyde dehydrogenase [Brucella pseudogrignonensis]PRA62208.1 NAD-dependent succinate-semialdehyde dehydrogenase [Brucella pseudogrignonensis]
MTDAALSRINGKIFIDGKLIDGHGGKIDVENPARGQVIGQIAATTREEIEQAVTTANAAFRSWSKVPAKIRAQALHRLGDLIAGDAESMAHIMTLEQGKPLNEAKGEILKLAEACHFYGEEAVRVFGKLIPNDQSGYQSQVIREPIGVVGAITPWNYPAELIGWKLCASLAAGCAIIIKPAEITPFTALAIAEKVAEAGIPAGVVGVLTGKGSIVGQALVDHPDVDKIAFTGSSAVGLQIQRSCLTVKRLSLELGGNCPLIVTSSADIDAAVKGAARRSFRNMGQICIAINRIYVERSLYQTFLEKFAVAANSLTIGDGILNPAADLGSMASAAPLEKTQQHLADALDKGARLVAGGVAPNGEEFANGHFFRPTIVADCTHAMKVMSEETFGPLVGLAPFDTLEEAINLANDTPYGLASYVYARDLREIYQLSAELDYGNVAINNVDAGIMNAPYGGRKQSGIGYEHGREGLLEYFNFKHIRLHHGVGA